MRHLASSLVAAVVVTWRVLPETLDARTRIVHLVVLPALWSLFYVAMVHGAGPSLPSPGDAVAAAAAVAGLGSTVAVAVLFVEDRFESTAPLLVAASGGTGAIWAGRVLTVCALATVTAVVGVVPVLFLTGGPRGPGGWATTAVVLACAAPAGVGPGLVLGAMGLRLPDACSPSRRPSTSYPFSSVSWHPWMPCPASSVRSPWPFPSRTSSRLHEREPCTGGTGRSTRPSRSPRSVSSPGLRWRWSSTDGAQRRRGGQGCMTRRCDAPVSPRRAR